MVAYRAIWKPASHSTPLRQIKVRPNSGFAAAKGIPCPPSPALQRPAVPTGV